MPKQKLFEEDSDGEVTFKTENEYSKKYDKWREKEELHKLEQKYGTKSLNAEGSISSESEDESDESPEISEETETQFLKTLALLKTKDPRIYDPDFKFFGDKEEKPKDEKPKIKTLTFDDTDDDDDDNDGNIFKIEKKAPEIGQPSKEKTPCEKSKEIKIQEFLTGKVEHIGDDSEKDLAPLKALWSDPKLNEGEAFLRDYILNKRYLDEGSAGVTEDKVRDDEDLEADEQRVEEQAHFERAYNFRFEEPDQEYLKRFPRTMNYIRPKDERRSRKRAEVRSRKHEEKTRKLEEIARLKALKLKEIHEKIARIKEVTGNDQLAFQEEDIEGDFDPEEHDTRMKALFDDQYYGEADDHKPVFPELDEELEIENWENYEKELEVNEKQSQGEEQGLHCEDEDFNMDADYDPKRARANLLEELQENMSKKRRNRKRKSKLASLLAAEKPKFVPAVAEKSYAEFMEQYYALDCEDVVGGDLPTRFKYRQVEPNHYGLTVEEILLADDKELTQWVPLKKIVKHRPAAVEKSDLQTYAKRAEDIALKRKILPSLFKDLPEEPEIVVPIEAAKTKKKKKKTHKNREEIESKENNKETEDKLSNKGTDNTEVVNVEVSTKSKKKKKLKNQSEVDLESSHIYNDVELSESNEVQDDVKDEELIANKKKKKKKHKVVDEIKEIEKSNEVNNKLNTFNEDTRCYNRHDSLNNDVTVSKKKKRQGEFLVEDVPTEAPSLANYENNKNMNLKRKLNETEYVKKQPFTKKKKLNSKQNNFKKFNKMSLRRESKEDSSVKLSDERLKAYGLNPKKYKKFMKFKKF